MEKSSRTTFHYVIQNDGARDLVLPPLAVRHRSMMIVALFCIVCTSFVAIVTIPCTCMTPPNQLLNSVEYLWRYTSFVPRNLSYFQFLIAWPGRSGDVCDVGCRRRADIWRGESTSAKQGRGLGTCPTASCSTGI